MNEKNRYHQELKTYYPNGDGIAARVAAAKRAHRASDPRAGIRAYCRGNKWLTANAKAVGNW